MSKNKEKSVTYEDAQEGCGRDTPLDLSGRKAPLFSLGENPFEALSNFTSLDTLGRPEKDLITAIFDLCGEDAEHLTDIEQVCYRLGQVERGGRTHSISESGVRKRISKLHGMGVLQKTFVTAQVGERKRHRITHYTIKTLDDIPALPRQTREPTVQQMDIFKDAQSLEWMDNPSLRIDDLFCQALSATLPIGERTIKTYIESKIYFQKHWLPIVVSSRAGQRIPTISSIKTLIALFSIVEQIIKERVQQGQTVGNRFMVNISDILKLKRQNNNGGNRRTILNHLKSWEATTFSVQDIDPILKDEFRERFGVDITGFHNHQLLTQLHGLSTKQHGQVVPTTIGFELSSLLVDRISQTGTYHLFTVTPSIMEEQDPMAIAFHMFCRKNIGHGTFPLQLTRRMLWQRMARSMTFNEFTKRFDRLIERKWEAERQRVLDDPEYMELLSDLEKQERKDEKKVSILGYRVHLIKDTIQILVDPDDPYVGIKSQHAALKQKTARLAASDADKKWRQENPDATTDKK